MTTKPSAEDQSAVADIEIAATNYAEKYWSLEDSFSASYDSFYAGCSWQKSRHDEARGTKTLAERMVIGDLVDKLQEAKELVRELFSQSCSDHHESKFKYDNLCISTYEDAQAQLIEWGMIKEDECSR